MASVENNNKNGAIKIAGYLEKKRRKRVVSKWKKYWFVLEGRLLLYYKSHFEVSNLCPCRGSINMGVAISVRPMNSQTHNITGIYMFEIVTHTNKRVLLRTKEKQIQEQWLQALLDALGGQPKLVSSRVHHFRYSLDSLTLVPQKSQSNIQFRRQYTLPQNIKNIELHRTKTFLGHLKCLTGRHTRSLDAILKKSKETEFMSTIRDDTSESSNSISEKDLVETEPKITKYHSLESITLNKSQELIKNKTDKNENCIIVENENYACITEISSTSSSTNNNTDEENWPNENVKIEIENELYNENKKDNVIVENCLYEGDNDQISQQSNSKLILNDKDNVDEIYAECDNNQEKKIDSNNSSKLELESYNERKIDDEVYSTTYDHLKTDFNSNMENVYIDIDEKILKSRLPPSQNMLEQNDDNVSNEKKKKMFQLKFKFIKKDSTNKVNKSVTPKVKKIAVRKESFMNKLFKHNKKKANSNNSTAKNDSECEYIDVESLRDHEETDKDLISNKTSTLGSQTRVFGGLEMLLPTTMQELNEKLNVERKKIMNRCYSDENDGIYEAIDTGQINDKPGINQLSKIGEFNTTEMNRIILVLEEIPGLPPRKGSRQRSRSPWHDVPTNNTPYLKQRNHHETIVSPNNYNNSEPIESLTNTNNLNHLYTEVHKQTQKKEELEENKIDSSELSVKQLIHRFDDTRVCVNDSKGQLRLTNVDDDVILRKDNDCLLTLSDDCDGRNSEDLNLLLNELSKITIAPLVQPRVINSLIQVKPTKNNSDIIQDHHNSCTPPVSDEEWLALGPIRRRRYSEPDYDVPRSHRSLDFVPPLPPKVNSTISELNNTSKLFNHPLNSTPLICDSIEPPSITWSRSITPDSLEPSDTHHNFRKHDELDRSMGIETITKNSPLISIKESSLGSLENDKKNNDIINEKFFDSLENSTSF